MLWQCLCSNFTWCIWRKWKVMFPLNVFVYSCTYTSWHLTGSSFRNILWKLFTDQNSFKYFSQECHTDFPFFLFYLFAINFFQPLTISAKRSILAAWQDLKYISLISQMLWEPPCNLHSIVVGTVNWRKFVFALNNLTKFGRRAKDKQKHYHCTKIEVFH